MNINPLTEISIFNKLISAEYRLWKSFLLKCNMGEIWQDMVNMLVPEKVIWNWDVAQKAVGFMNMHKILKKLKIVATDNVEIPNLRHNPMLDLGEVATMPKRQQSLQDSYYVECKIVSHPILRHYQHKIL